MLLNFFMKKEKKYFITFYISHKSGIKIFLKYSINKCSIRQLIVQKKY